MISLNTIFTNACICYNLPSAVQRYFVFTGLHYNNVLTTCFVLPGLSPRVNKVYNPAENATGRRSY